MKSLRRSVLLGCIIFAAANAQWGGPYGRRGPDRDRGYGDYRYGSSPVDRVLSDLSSTRSYRFVDGHERKHMDKAYSSLLRFRDNWARGRFDRDRLDEAIENLDHLAGADQVNPRERRLFARDRDMLRDFRASRGGGRYRGWPY